MKSKISTLARKVEELEGKRLHEVQAVTENTAQANPCINCQPTVDRPKTRCVKCTPMCASARVAPSNIAYQRYGYRSTGTGVLTTKVLLLR